MYLYIFSLYSDGIAKDRFFEKFHLPIKDLLKKNIVIVGKDWNSSVWSATNIKIWCRGGKHILLAEKQRISPLIQTFNTHNLCNFPDK